MIEDLLLVGLSCLGAFLVALVIGIRIFVRLAQQQRQIDLLTDRLETLAQRAARPAAEPRVAAQPASAPAAAPAPAPRPAPPRIVVEPPPAVPLQADVELPPIAREIDSIETLIGSRWLLYVGVIAIVIGVAYFEKLAFENHWVSETARVVQGGFAGLALIYAGIRFSRAGYAAYGQMISGCGAAILYVSTYAAFNFYHLIDRPLAFVLMAVITAGTAVLADVELSQGLAVLAVGGGFATPFLLPGTSDAQIALFGYDTVLIAGTLALSRRRDWPLLDMVSYLFTLLTVAAWANRFYTPAKYLRTEIFLTAFCAMFLGIVFAHRRSTSPAAAGVRLFLWTAPVAYYGASLAVLGDHPVAMLVWLVCLMLAGAMLTTSFGARAGFGVWCAVTLPLLLWTASHGTTQWLRAGLITVAAVYAIALTAQIYAVVEQHDFGKASVAWLHLNALLMFAGAYLLIQPIRGAANAGVAAGFAAWHGALALATLARQRDWGLHFAGVAFTLLMIAIGLQYDGAAMTIGWAAEGAIVVALGLREKREWLRLGGAILFVVALLRTVDLLTSVAPIHIAPLLNARTGCAAFIALLCYVLAWLHHRDSEQAEGAIAVAIFLVAAQLVTLMLLTSEINTYWAARQDAFAREFAKSATWALYSMVLIVIGLHRDYAPIRYVAIVVFALTTVKVFAVDLAQLERVYRILSIIGLGVALLVTSWLYQRARRSSD